VYCEPINTRINIFRPRERSIIHSLNLSSDSRSRTVLINLPVSLILVPLFCGHTAGRTPEPDHAVNQLSLTATITIPRISPPLSFTTYPLHLSIPLNCSPFNVHFISRNTEYPRFILDLLHRRFCASPHVRFSGKGALICATIQSCGRKASAQISDF
jgi:hypothetical protein